MTFFIKIAQSYINITTADLKMNFSRHKVYKINKPNNMQEETKEEYISRLRREQGLTESFEILEEEKSHLPEPQKFFKEKLRGFFFLLLFALFLWAIIEMFGMMKAN